MPDKSTLDRRGLGHLLVVYLVWGSTYLAIRLAVRPEAGFPPFMMAGTRVTTAALILLGWAKLRGERIRLSGSEFLLFLGSGLLLWVGGNGLVTWAEMHATSGLAALLVASIPIWFELVAMVVDRRLPGGKLAASILLGFCGVGILVWPILRSGIRADVLAVIALLLAPMFWAIGSVWFQRRKPDLSIRAISGWQQLCGSMGFLVVVLLRKEPLPTPTPQAWLAWGYLMLFGSIIAFTSYMNALRRLPASIVSTYAYVNPIIAVLLGWLILKESVTGYTLAGAGLVIASVTGIFRNRV